MAKKKVTKKKTVTKTNNELCRSKNGIWIAEAGENEFYSPGEVFIKTDKKNCKIPKYLGEKAIPEPNNLIKLINDVSIKMVDVLKCERVYLVSLGESTEMGVHFRLLPRYHEDQGFLDDLDPETNETDDGLALMAHWRKQFLMKKIFFEKQKDSKSNPFIDLQKKHDAAIKKLQEALK